MNTTSGHQTDTIVWTSDNDLWAIERRDVYHRNGEIDHTTWFIYGGYLAVRWPINDTTLTNDFYPKYVRQAIRRHVPQA